MAHREMRGLQVGMHIHPFLDGTAWWQSVIQEFSGTSITHPNALVLKAFHILIKKKKNQNMHRNEWKWKQNNTSWSSLLPTFSF